MPVRIYDIAKKLGIESKEVLAKAKELGITAAKVPSSSLDKITAEYLFEQFGSRQSVPESEAPAPTEHVVIVTKAPEPPPAEPVAAPASVSADPVAAAVPVAEETVRAAEPLIEPQASSTASVVARPPEPVTSEKDLPAVAQGIPESTAAETISAAPISVPEAPKTASSSGSVVPEAASSPLEKTRVPATEPRSAAQPASPTALVTPSPSSPSPAEVLPPTPPPVAPAQPAAPPAPRIGDKVGFIQLPTRPSAKPPERPQPGRPAQGQSGQAASGQQRPGGGFRQGQDSRFQRGDNRSQGQYGQRPAQGSFQRGQQSAQSTPQRPSGEPKFVPPTSGELITLKPPIIVRELAEQLRRKPFQLIADLMEMNVFANVNQAIDETVAQKLSAKYGFRFELEKRERGAGIVHAPKKEVELDKDDKPEELVLRAPVVTIMGHVDHGKTTLLDVIRKSNVASGEAGGITQHIGAYTISVPHPDRPKDMQQITFLDTPGHAAFSSMRARGANVTDIVILVVAANDGVMPQTLEALSHAKAARVPIIVAVNKCDHPNANPMKVRQQLQDKGLVCEEWGGDTIFQDVSAISKQGIDKLLELIVLQAEVMELKANPNRRAKGNIIESGLEPGGPTATVLVRKGTLKVGDVLICGQFWGKVRALINEEGKRLKEAGPSVAVKVLGLNGVPEAGLEFSVVENEKSARMLGEDRAMAARNLDNERRPKVTLENLFDTLASEGNKILKVVVKADTQGSVEAIVEALKKIETTKVALEVIHSAVGTITESDVVLASASKAIVLGFHTRIDNGVSEASKREGVQIKLYAIIYELIDQVKEAMAGLLDPLVKEVTIGSAEVRKIFELSKGGSVAGCVVASGRIVKGKMRVYRRKGLIYEGVSLSLRRFQDEVNEVRAGMECGIRLDGFSEFQVGDSIECYSLEKVPQKL